MDNPKKELFEFKLNLITQELDTINQIVDRHDHFTQTTKNWAVLLWIGSISLILKEFQDKSFQNLLFFTPIIPLLFWIVDATWRRLQNRSIYRIERISEFLNSQTFVEAYHSYNLNAFRVWDIIGRSYRDEESYKQKTSFFRAFRFGSVWRFYMGMILLSLLISLVVKVL